MPVASAPLIGARFVVEIGGVEPIGFSEVVFPDFLTASEAPAPLLLRRAATGTLDLYEWWDIARGKSRGAIRDVSVQLIDGNGEPVLRWRFLRAVPLALSYSGLDASQSGLVIETLTLSFERMEMG